jgi:hypothetical protein
MTIRKQYDEDSGHFGAAGELAGINLLRKFGFVVSRLPNGKYGQDSECVSERERFFCEFERRSRSSWNKSSDRFPFPTYNYLERRPKNHNSILVVLREDMEVALIVFGSDASHFPVMHVRNVHSLSEDVRQVPAERCLLVNKTTDTSLTFASLNSRRVREAVMNASLPTKVRMRYLEPCCPYGVTDIEYTELLSAVSEDSHKKITTVKRQVFQQGFLF